MKDKERIMRVAMYCRVGNDRQDEDDKLKKLSLQLQEKLRHIYRQSLLDRNKYSFIDIKIG